MTVTPEKTICVFCGSSFGKNASFTKAATELGNLLASKKYGLVYGGGTTGLMGIIAKTVASQDGYVHGIIPDALVTKERSDSVDEINKKIQTDVENHKGETPLDDSYGKTTIVTDMHTRKKMMGMEANGGFVAMPGGFGTLEEIMEVTTWSQLGIHKKPVVLFNVDGFYDEFIKFLDSAVEAGFISKNNSSILAVANTAEEVVEKLDNYVVPEGRFNLTWKNN
ncbi:hypothetical protein OGAPHI_006422 [Ogataea philodendri]|uniref:LOG family protein n=1 Tax=Ogataea philodendri TaxID=1378263 RepID=A0A9P8NYV3_9ASCO|nr:uncharacterized protein OGAPHI_006422 [Ogataea philodendri]KAH3661574.1 hypothetical protein OGAPHI_006422 [Ogataea philodendri]